MRTYYKLLAFFFVSVILVAVTTDNEWSLEETTTLSGQRVLRRFLLLLFLLGQCVIYNLRMWAKNKKNGVTAWKAPTIKKKYSCSPPFCLNRVFTLHSIVVLWHHRNLWKFCASLVHKGSARARLIACAFVVLLVPFQQFSLTRKVMPKVCKPKRVLLHKLWCWAPACAAHRIRQTTVLCSDSSLTTTARNSATTYHASSYSPLFVPSRFRTLGEPWQSSRIQRLEQGILEMHLKHHLPIYSLKSIFFCANNLTNARATLRNDKRDQRLLCLKFELKRQRNPWWCWKLLPQMHKLKSKIFSLNKKQKTFYKPSFF